MEAVLLPDKQTQTHTLARMHSALQVVVSHFVVLV